jgi:hypothetical protein
MGGTSCKPCRERSMLTKLESENHNEQMGEYVQKWIINRLDSTGLGSIHLRAAVSTVMNCSK